VARELSIRANSCNVMKLIASKRPHGTTKGKTDERIKLQNKNCKTNDGASAKNPKKHCGRPAGALVISESYVELTFKKCSLVGCE